MCGDALISQFCPIPITVISIAVTADSQYFLHRYDLYKNNFFTVITFCNLFFFCGDGQPECLFSHLPSFWLHPPDVFYGLIPRWTCEINSTDLGNGTTVLVTLTSPLSWFTLNVKKIFHLVWLQRNLWYLPPGHQNTFLYFPPRACKHQSFLCLICVLLFLLMKSFRITDTLCLFPLQSPLLLISSVCVFVNAASPVSRQHGWRETRSTAVRCCRQVGKTRVKTNPLFNPQSVKK